MKIWFNIILLHLKLKIDVKSVNFIKIVREFNQTFKKKNSDNIF